MSKNVYTHGDKPQSSWEFLGHTKV